MSRFHTTLTFVSARTVLSHVKARGNTMRKLSLELEELFGANPDGIGLGELMDTLSHRGYGFLLVVLSLPAALPIPAAGYASPFALVIIVLAFQMMLGRSSPSLPQRVLGRKISARMVPFIQGKGIPLLRRIERFSKPRLESLIKRRLLTFLVGLTIILAALVMLVPFPGTNTIPAFGILVIGFGLINNDGLLALCGSLLGLTGAAAVITLLIVGGSALHLW